MSVEAITWALKQPVKQSSAKFVLVALANCSNSADGTAWPSIAYLCEATSQDRKTVMANLKRLIETGYIKDTGNRMGGTKSVVVYQICNTEIGTPSKPEAVPETDTSSAEIGTTKQYQKRDISTSEAVPFFPPSSTVFPHKQYQNSLEAVPKTVHGTVRNRNRTVKEDKTELLSQLPASLVSDFQQIRKAKKLPLTQTAVNGLQREADKAGLSLEDAVRICCEYGWAGFNAGWYADRQGKAAKSEPAWRTEQRNRTLSAVPAIAQVGGSAIEFFDVEAKNVTSTFLG